MKPYIYILEVIFKDSTDTEVSLSDELINLGRVELNKGNSFKIGAVYTATILGAGFASGKELMNFFVINNKGCYLGLVIAGILFAFFGFITLEICREMKITSYDEFVGVVFGKQMGKVIGYVVPFFLFILFATMLAAGGEMVKQVFNIPLWTGVLFLAILCFTAFLNDLDGIIELNAILAPFMVIGGILIGTLASITPLEVFGTQTFFSGNELTRAILYTSYNTITAIAVLVPLSKYASNRKTSLFGATSGAIAMTLLGFFLILPMVNNVKRLVGEGIPMLPLAENLGVLIKYIYIIIFFAAIFTTAIANGFAFLNWLTPKLGISKLNVKLIVVGSGALIAQIGFSNFIGKVYPIFGFFGVAEVAFLIYAYFVKFRGIRALKTIEKTNIKEE